MKKNIEILKSCDLFDGIGGESISAMLGCLGAKSKNFKKNEMIFEEGSPARSIGIVLSGSAQVVKIDYYGNRTILTELVPTQIFGESFACAGAAALPVCVAAKENSEIMLIDVEKITHSCSNSCEFHSRIIFNLLKMVAQKNLLFNEKIEITSKRTTREKLMTYLLQQAKRNDSNEFTISFDRQELADYLEVDRSGLSVQISRLCKEGVIECSRNRFHIC